MNNYTLDIFTMERDPKFKLFDFEYKFYSNDVNLKADFEQRFRDKYKFYEVGYETVARFKHELKRKIEEKHDYYKKLYETELATIDTDFLSNKFYDETQTKENSRTDRENFTADSDETLTNNLTLAAKESSINNGVSDVNLSNGLTGVNENKSTGTAGTISNNSGNREKTTSDTETLTIHGKGSIGVVTNDVMLKGWRSILLDINNQIVDECRSLFLYVY